MLGTRYRFWRRRWQRRGNGLRLRLGYLYRRRCQGALSAKMAFARW